MFNTPFVKFNFPPIVDGKFAIIQSLIYPELERGAT